MLSKAVTSHTRLFFILLPLSDAAAARPLANSACLRAKSTAQIVVHRKINR